MTTRTRSDLYDLDDGDAAVVSRSDLTVSAAAVIAWVMRFGTNREQSLCADCGHPSMAHLDGGCYCGCPRATRIPEPTPSQSNAPVNQFIDFMLEHLSQTERNRLIELVAAHKGVPAPFGPRTHARTQEFVVKNLTQTETLRYLNELRRRLLDE